jgi:hypothetical protein
MFLNKQPWTLTTLRIGPPILLACPPQTKRRRKTLTNKGLKCLYQRKPAGPDHLDPYFLKLGADFIAELRTYLFNRTLECNEIPRTWKSAFVLPLLKGGDPTLLNNYRPISKLSPLAENT